MRQVVQLTRFRKDYKRQKRRGKNMNILDAVVLFLMQHGRVPVELRPHKLSGEYEGLWECHLGFDWLLVYDVNKTTVFLYHTGSHDDLF